jgi:Flp pilus assembly protein TadG
VTGATGTGDKLGHGLLARLRHGAADESGVVIVLVAIMMVAILASAAVAIDLGSFYSAQRRAQAAADAGALAAAQDLVGTSSTSYSADGTTIATTNYPGATVTVSQPTSSTAKVVVNASTPVLFGHFLGMTKENVSATAVASMVSSSQPCSTPGGSCAAIFAMDSNCSDDGVTFIGGGDNVNGAVWSNGSANGGGGGSTLGAAIYGSTAGCSWTPTGYGTPTPVAQTPSTSWPIDYRPDFPACTTTCTGPGGTPSFCTKVSTAATWDLVPPASGQIYCAVGSGTASNPATWNGTIVIGNGNDGSSGSPIESSYVAGELTFNGGGDYLTACGYASTGYKSTACNASVPTPGTTNYPLAYVVSSSTGFDDTSGGNYLTGDIMAPNGTIKFDGGGDTCISLLEGQDVTYTGGGLKGDGPVYSGSGFTSTGTVSLLQ